MQFSFSGNNNSMQPMGQIPIATKTVSPRIGSIILLVVAAIFIAIGVFSIFRGDQTKNWPTVTGQVINSYLSNTMSNNNNSSRDYNVTVKYTVNGSEYTTHYTSSTSPTYGKEVAVRYDPNKPSNADIGEVGFFGWIFVAVGGVLALVAIILFVTLKGKDQRTKAYNQASPALDVKNDTTPPAIPNPPQFGA
jgi:hypothetical protein